jgi:hypothetical protein
MHFARRRDFVKFGGFLKDHTAAPAPARLDETPV